MLLRAWKPVIEPRRRRLALEFLERRTLLSTLPLPWVGGEHALVVDPASYHPSRVLVSLKPGAEAAGEIRWHGTPVIAARPLLGGLWEVELGPETSVGSAMA